MSYDITLGVPVLNQLTTQTTDGRPNENASYDCGPTCVASVLQYLTGVKLLPDEIKDMIWSLTGQTAETGGYGTSKDDLRAFFLQRTNLTPVDISVTSTGEAMKAIRDSVVGAGMPMIGIFSFSAPHTQPLHWRVIDGAAGPDLSHTSLVRGMNPWGGYRWEQSNTDTFAWLADNYPTVGASYLMGFQAA